MKILLDENLPRKLKVDLGPENEVLTIGDMGWNGKKYGELLGLMVTNGFEGFVTIDKNLQYQQHIAKFRLQIYILNAVSNRIETLRPFVQQLRAQLQEDIEEQIVVIRVED